METILMNTENGKTNEPQLNKIFVPNMPLKSNLKKNIKKEYNNNKLKIIAPTWNDEFELRNGFYAVSDIQDYIEYIIKNMKHHLQILLFIFTSIGSITDYENENAPSLEVVKVVLVQCKLVDNDCQISLRCYILLL